MSTPEYLNPPFLANEQDIYTVMVGKDGKEYIVDMKLGRKVWDIYVDDSDDSDNEELLKKTEKLNII